ncbi:unnamed protein product [Nesidiocoris tenuis]|uniref:Uncharacterized protein n=1 Tax=Nesidiocoris tenuis TaxID=355587 RepID=A0A6H5G3R6_9HEMI|nr:unnamed protein product [Nesidiocoris tenuis]
MDCSAAEKDQGNEKPQGAGASAAENGGAKEKGCDSKKAAAEVKDFEYVDDFCGTAEEHRNSLYISMESRPLHLVSLIFLALCG